MVPRKDLKQAHNFNANQARCGTRTGFDAKREILGPPAPLSLRQGELAWIAYTSMFGGNVGEWDDLSLADRARWSCVEAGILREASPVPVPTGVGERV